MRWPISSVRWGTPRSSFTKISRHPAQKKRFLFVAGGVGTAPVYPQVKWLHEHGRVKADVIIGAKTKSMLIYTEEMARVADNLYIATDDGSEGFKGMVTALIKDLIDNRGKQYDVCVAIGPMIMMKFVTLTTKEYSCRRSYRSIR